LESLMMKKTLVALAAVAVTGAYAQVSITGNIDMGVRAVNSQTITSQATGIAKNNASTSTMEFKGSEDLGGGLKAGFQLQWTITPEAAGTENAASQATTGAANTQYFTGGPFNSEQFLSLSGDFGTVKVGEPNAAVYRAQFSTQPLGTGLGSGYGGTVSRMGYVGAYGLSSYMGNTPGAQSSLRVIRMQKTMQYESPVFNGLSAMAEYSFANDNSTTITSNSPSFMGVLVNYNAGPMNLVAAQNTYKTGTNYSVAGNAVGFSTTQNALAKGQEVVYQLLGANYKMGQHTFYTGLTNVRASDATEDSQSWNVAYKFAVNSNVDVMANVVGLSSSLNNTGSFVTLGNTATSAVWNLNRKIIGFGADYRLSKRTNLYVRYENYDSNTDNVSTGEQISTAFGVRHQF
jgi:predicted porin